MSYSSRRRRYSRDRNSDYHSDTEVESRRRSSRRGREDRRGSGRSSRRDVGMDIDKFIRQLEKDEVVSRDMKDSELEKVFEMLDIGTGRVTERDYRLEIGDNQVDSKKTMCRNLENLIYSASKERGRGRKGRRSEDDMDVGRRRSRDDRDDRDRRRGGRDEKDSKMDLQDSADDAISLIRTLQKSGDLDSILDRNDEITEEGAQTLLARFRRKRPREINYKDEAIDLLCGKTLKQIEKGLWRDYKQNELKMLFGGKRESWSRDLDSKEFEDHLKAAGLKVSPQNAQDIFKFASGRRKTLTWDDFKNASSNSRASSLADIVDSIIEELMDDAKYSKELMKLHSRKGKFTDILFVQEVMDHFRLQKKEVLNIFDALENGRDFIHWNEFSRICPVGFKPRDVIFKDFELDKIKGDESNDPSKWTVLEVADWFKKQGMGYLKRDVQSVGMDGRMLMDIRDEIDLKREFRDIERRDLRDIMDEIDKLKDQRDKAGGSDFKSWKTAEVVDWLKKQKFGRNVREAFEDAGVRGKHLAGLDDTTLRKELRIERRDADDVLDAIQDLVKKSKKRVAFDDGITSWNHNKVLDWIEENGFEKMIRYAEKYKINGKDLANLNERKLESYGLRRREAEKCYSEIDKLLRDQDRGGRSGRGGAADGTDIDSFVDTIMRYHPKIRERDAEEWFKMIAGREKTIDWKEFKEQSGINRHSNVDDIEYGVKKYVKWLKRNGGGRRDDAGINNIRDWSEDDVGAFLKEKGFASFKRQFMRAHIDGGELIKLKEAEMKDMGMKNRDIDDFLHELEKLTADLPRRLSKAFSRADRDGDGGRTRGGEPDAEVAEMEKYDIYDVKGVQSIVEAQYVVGRGRSDIIDVTREVEDKMYGKTIELKGVDLDRLFKENTKGKGILKIRYIPTARSRYGLDRDRGDRDRGDRDRGDRRDRRRERRDSRSPERGRRRISDRSSFRDRV